MTKLGRFLGIDVQLHWSLGILMLVVMFSMSERFGLAGGILGAVVVPLSILAHEYGHALTGRAFKIDTHNITLMGLGGVASMYSVGKKWHEEFWIALAGPAVSVVLAFGLGSLGVVLDSRAVVWLGIINLILAIFNMLPAYPTDGGRVLHAICWKFVGEVRATLWASNVAIVVASGLVVLGIRFFDPFMVLIAAFIIWNAWENRKKSKAVVAAFNHHVDQRRRAYTKAGKELDAKIEEFKRRSENPYTGGIDGRR
jgi:Zn-dependent protease